MILSFLKSELLICFFFFSNRGLSYKFVFSKIRALVLNQVKKNRALSSKFVASEIYNKFSKISALSNKPIFSKICIFQRTGSNFVLSKSVCSESVFSNDRVIQESVFSKIRALILNLSFLKSEL